MDWIPVVLALGVLGVVGLIFGILLEVADKKLAVEVDPRISKVGEALGLSLIHISEPTRH